MHCLPFGIWHGVEQLQNELMKAVISSSGHIISCAKFTQNLRIGSQCGQRHKIGHKHGSGTEGAWLEQAGFPTRTICKQLLLIGPEQVALVQLAARARRSKTHSANVAGKIVLAQLIPVLDVLLWVLEELLYRDGHPADTCVLQQAAASWTHMYMVHKWVCPIDCRL